MQKKLTVLGSANADHVIHVPHFSQPGETLTGYDYQIAYGGKGANQAVAAARLKAPELTVQFLGCVGADAIGSEMKQALSQEGLDTTYLRQIPNLATGIAMIQVNDAGENSIVIASGANSQVNDDYVAQHTEILAQTDCLLMQLETPLSAVMQSAKIAKEHGAQVVLNPAPACPLPSELFQFIDIITPNETEAEILTGVKVTDEQSAKQASEFFHQHGVKMVLITLGAKGVFLSQQGAEAKIITGFRVKAVDTTAAGDTFNGGFICALLENADVENAIRFGQSAAAISVTRKGAQPSIPSRSETLNFLAQK